MLSYGNAQYIYSRNGELQKKIVETDTTSYAYDYFGNLLSVRLPRHGGQADGDFIEYMIDAQNHRIGKKLNGNVIKRWVYAGGLLPIAELDSAGNIMAQFVGNLMLKNGNTYQLITDHLGSVRLVVNVSDGTIAQQLDYDEYGNITQNTNPDFQPFAYAGGLYDSQTKLVRFGARDYDASVGRWTCKDPIGFKGESFNIYGYCSNDPINYYDDSGLKLWYANANALVIDDIYKSLVATIRIPLLSA
jgi:RHS repeat-associated protein